MPAFRGHDGGEGHRILLRASGSGHQDRQSEDLFLAVPCYIRLCIRSIALSAQKTFAGIIDRDGNANSYNTLKARPVEMITGRASHNRTGIEVRGELNEYFRFFRWTSRFNSNPSRVVALPEDHRSNHAQEPVDPFSRPI